MVNRKRLSGQPKGYISTPLLPLVGFSLGITNISLEQPSGLDEEERFHSFSDNWPNPSFELGVTSASPLP
jgi:hypothetical protein